MVSNFLDIVYVIIIGISLATGIQKGAVKLIIGFTFFILSFVFTYLLLAPISEIVSEYVPHSLIANIISGLATYVVSAIFCGIISGTLQKLVKDISGGGADRMLGLVLGTARGSILIFILSVLIMIVVNKSYKDAHNVLELVDLKKTEKEPHWLASSRINPVLQNILEEAIDIIGKDTLKKTVLPKPKNQEQLKPLLPKKDDETKVDMKKEVFDLIPKLTN